MDIEDFLIKLAIDRGRFPKGKIYFNYYSETMTPFLENILGVKFLEFFNKYLIENKKSTIEAINYMYSLLQINNKDLLNNKVFGKTLALFLFKL